jgi:hypothetical protein
LALWPRLPGGQLALLLLLLLQRLLGWGQHAPFLQIGAHRCVPVGTLAPPLLLLLPPRLPPQS